MCVSNFFFTPLLHLAPERQGSSSGSKVAAEGTGAVGGLCLWGQGCCRAEVFGVLQQFSFSLFHTGSGAQAMSTGFMATILAHQEGLGSGALCGTYLFRVTELKNKFHSIGTFSLIFPFPSSFDAPGFIFWLCMIQCIWHCQEKAIQILFK